MYNMRMKEIITYCANRASKQEKQSSGLWHHHDIRNNFYDASYLFAAAVDEKIDLKIDREAAKNEAEQVMLKVLRLQDRQAGSETYGHWPLRLMPSPEEAKVNPLPAELMGLLMVYFYKKYEHELSPELKNEFEAVFKTLHNSNFYRGSLHYYHHHEAKYTAAKLIYGQFFQDEKLLEDGVHSLKATLKRIQEVGMTEYGCLPWFWHWVQAFTCAYELTDQPSLRETLKELLDYLWDVRASFYLNGAWVGAHSRGLPHDLPADGNVLFDYVQFGDFPFPTDVPRVEYAGFLHVMVPQAIYDKVSKRTFPHEVKQLVPAKPEASNHSVLHSYVYMEESFAAGGMWERATEFDNEQQRWGITFPLTGDGGSNRVYFFHPGQFFGGIESEDWTHQSNKEQVVLDKSAILAYYPIGEDEHEYIIGCLPKGEWLFEEKAIFGYYKDSYIAILLQQSYSKEERNKAWRIVSPGKSNAVAVEAYSRKTAEERGITTLEQFATAARSKLSLQAQDNTVQFITWLQDDLKLHKNAEAGSFVPQINGSPISFEDYSVREL